MSFAAAEDGRNILCWIFNVFHANNASEEDVFGCVGNAGWHDSGTIDKVDTLHKSDVLPDLGLSGDGRCGADLLLAKCVDDGGFPCVGIADETHGYLFAGAVERRKLPE